MKPKNFEDLADYCMQQLGSPVIDIHVAEEQVQNRIEDAFDFFNDFHGDSQDRALYKHQITQTDITNGFLTLPTDVMAVMRVLPFSNTGAGSLFSPEYQYRADLVYQMLQGGGGLSGYVTSMSYLSMMQDILVGEKTFTFNRFTRRLVIQMDWASQVQVGQWIVVELYQTVDMEEFTDIFNNRMLKKLATAYVKKQWGSNVKLHSGIVLLGGVTVNGQTIYDEAMAEIENIEEEIKSTYQEPPMPMMG